MSIEQEINKLENRQVELKVNILDIINQPINDKSINDAQTRGVDIISESINNSILITLFKMGDNTKT